MRRRQCVFTLLFLFALPVTQAAELVRFVSCPIYRDTQAGRKSGCWLMDDPATGIRYDVTPSPVKPDWNYAALVEGVMSQGDANPCGGAVLEPASVSVLAERCPRHMLPAEGYPGRPFSLPARNIRPLSEERPTPPGPYDDTTFFVFFEFNKHFVIYQYGDYLIDEAVTWLRAAKPKKITVTGYAVTEEDTVSGRRLQEDADLARERAEVIHEALLRFGLPADRLDVEWQLNPAPVEIEAADGLPAASRRRVEIRAEM